MNRIRLLSEQAANQIAAGEVVERPASVVKELVENALDAQATRITIEVQTGGRSLIRVTDDGCGMSRDDALLCLERHATSKIQSAADLSEIRTMGFRGEAVPSIASVSRMTLTTREREGGGESGTQIVLQGGRILEVKEAGSAPGTCVEVRNLFFNLPARRKFLRSEETERAHIQHYLSLAALAFPEVAFTFLDDQRVVWQLPQACQPGRADSLLPALQERLRGLYGAERQLLSVDYTESVKTIGSAEDGEADHDNPIRIWGFIGAPGLSRATRDEQHLFVNRRPVENRGLNFALLEGYHTSLMKGRYPICCLFLEIDPAVVDVNIHPAKREVKFHQEQVVRRILTQAVRAAILRFHGEGDPTGPAEQQRSAEITPEPKSSASNLTGNPEPGSSDAMGQPTSVTTPDAGNNLILLPDPPPAKTFSQDLLPVRLGPGAGWNVPPSEALRAESASAPIPSLGADGDNRAARPTGGAPTVGPTPLLQVPLRLVGVIGQLYVVLESDRGLVLLDQHAAHERILFEQMLGRLEQGNAPSQRLLLPETIELSPRDAQFLREQLPCLTRLGVGLSEFGDRTFLLDAVPPFVKMSEARPFVIEMLDGLKAAGESVNSWRLAEQTVAKTVCRHAVKANDPLSEAELNHLVSDLRQCAMPYTCPHGRPTLIEMSFRDLDKKFGRTQ